MKHYIIGSRLMKSLFPTNPKIIQRCKDTADYDVLIDHEPTERDKQHFKSLYGSKTECHYIPAIWDYFETERQLANVLFTLKASHIPWDKVHKKKTFYDLYLLNGEGCEIIEPLFYELTEYWKIKFGEKWRADFTKESSDFFDDAVSRENVHDELHETVKIFDKPAFRYLQDEGQTTVYVCPDKFANLPYEYQEAVIIEEARVLAIERDLSTPNGIKNQYAAYCKWLEAMVDRIAPEWQIPFICNNFVKLLNKKEQYYEH